MLCSGCGVAEIPMVPRAQCNACSDAEDSPYRLRQRADGFWERYRVVRHNDGTWEWYEPTPEEKRKDAQLTNFAEWMFGSDKD